jgi:NAD(P)-dependent dehydrogenase (short-subunit alcohol dehydrogenase family)
MECLYKELVASGSTLRASVVCPGFIRTNLMEAERNRSRKSRDTATAPSAGAMAMEAMLRTGLESGYPPSVVADAVLDGIRDERFWVIPSRPELKANIAVRLDEIRDERNPALVVGGAAEPS